MATAPRKQAGRPKKSALEKQQQFSISLTPPQRIMLEMIARDQKVSLSQAVEQLVNEKSSTYLIDGETVASIVIDRAAFAAKKLINIGGDSPGGAGPKEALVFSSRFANIFLIPERLLSIDERALAEACIQVKKLPTEEQMERLAADCVTMATLGISMEKIRDYAVQQLSFED